MCGPCRIGKCWFLTLPMVDYKKSTASNVFETINVSSASDSLAGVKNVCDLIDDIGRLIIIHIFHCTGFAII